jgi:ABC-type multidrug transport system fused ATPase/permease subunit
MRDLIVDIWSYVRPYKYKFFFGTFLRACGDLAWLYPYYATSLVVNFFTEPASVGSVKSIESLYPIFFLMILAVLVRFFGLYYAKIFVFEIAEKCRLDVEYKSLKHLVSLDMSWQEKENAGSKFKRIDKGSEGVHKILRIWINNVIEITINLVGIIFILIKFDLKIASILVFFLVTFYFFSKYFRKKAIIAHDVVSAKEELRAGLIFESIDHIRSVKVMSMLLGIMNRLSKNANDLFLSIKRRVFWFQSGNTFRNIYGHLFRAGSIIFISFGIYNGSYEVGFLVLFVGYFTQILSSISELVDISEDFAIAKKGVERLKYILNTKINIDDENGKVSFPKNWQKIYFKDLSFSYQNKSVLENLSFEIKRGEKIGIVGLSGAGKSTLFKLILKEHELNSGELLFENVSIKDISKKDYFNYVAVVLQDTELFNSTLKENIIITNSEEENNSSLLDKAVEIAHVKDFMDKLPFGMDTVIGEKGVKLSGGEKQRVGIARAVFKNPQLFLLDEATSHLDIESEQKIQDSLHKFFKDVTAIVIAHRLTTIKEMDRIIVMEDGKIVEIGNFEELYSKRGRFYELWERQKI